MTDDFVSFDSIRQRVHTILESIDLAPLRGTDVYLVRNLYGRVRVIADERVSVSESARSALTDLATRFSQELGAHGHPPDSSLLTIDTSAFRLLDRSARRITDRLFWIDRMVTNAGWWTVDKPDLRRDLYTLFSTKGGVGRTTTAVVLAWHLARRGERVLVVDLDVESPGLGSAALERDVQPDVGVVDWFVEDSVGWGYHVVERMTGTPAWAGDLEGTVTVVPAHGRDPGEYLAKLGRVYLDTDVPWIKRIHCLIAELQAAWNPTVVLIDSRCGFHDIAAATVTDLGAHVLLFATDSYSNWANCRILFDHWREHDLAEPMRDRLSIVSALTPELGTDEYLASFAERSWDLFRDHLYDDVAPLSTGNEFSFALHEPSAPHHPLPIHWNRGLAAGSSLHRIDATPVGLAYSAFLQSFDARVRPTNDQ